MYSLEMTLNLTSFCHHHIVNNNQINLFSPEQKKKTPKETKKLRILKRMGKRKKGLADIRSSLVLFLVQSIVNICLLRLFMGLLMKI